MEEPTNKDQIELDIIHTYTRQQAIADGILIDIEKDFVGLSSQAGFNFPVALTFRAFSRYVALNPNATLEDPTGRLWDILWMLRVKIKQMKKETLDTVRFPFLCTVPDHKEPFAIETDPPEEEEDDDFVSLEELLEKAEQRKKFQLCWLKAVFSPDENNNGSITIMLPWED